MKQNNEHINKDSSLKRNKEVLNVTIFFVAILLVSIYILNLVQNKHQRNILGGVYQYSSYEIPGGSNHVPASQSTTYHTQSRSHPIADNISLPNDNMGGNNPGAVNSSNSVNTNNSFDGSVMSNQKVKARTSKGGSSGSFAGAGIAIAQSSNRSRSESSKSGFSTSIPGASSAPTNNINSSSNNSNNGLGVGYQTGQGGTDPGGNPNKKNKLPIKNGNVFLVVSALLYGAYKYYSSKNKKNSSPSS